MFEIPNAKRVRRSEIQSPSTSSSRSTSPDPAISAALKARFDTLYGNDDTPINSEDQTKPASPPQAASNEPPPPPTSKPQETETETAYEFRLFSTPHPTNPSPNPTASHPAPSRIILSSPPPAAGPDTGSLQHSRPLSYYLTSALPPSTQSQRQTCFEAAALSSTQILAIARNVRYTGCFLPWRVQTLKLPKAVIKALRSPEVEPVENREGLGGSRTNIDESRKDGEEKGGDKGRKKPSKKRRIAMRVKAARVKEEGERKAREEREEGERKERVEREEREKRTRRNRERKVKRKVREKRKKMEAATAGEGMGDGEKERGEVGGEGVTADDVEGEEMDEGV